jgi:hypothetical protein
VASAGHIANRRLLMANKITSFVVPEELLEVLRQRAKVNKRSVSAEINYLIELGLSSTNEDLQNLLRVVSELS